MDGSYQLAHDGITCWLTPRSWAGDLWLALAALSSLLAVGGLVASVTFGPAWLALCGVVGAVVAVVAGDRAIRRRAVRRLECRGRTLTVRVGRQGHGGPLYRMSLLDLERAIATADGWLVLEPDPGPLPAIWLDARGVDPTHLEAIAAALTTAADRAEAHRGDFPVAATRDVEQLLQR